MDKLTGIVEGTKSGWNKIDKKKKIAMIVFFIVVILFTLFFTYSLNKVNYVPLFRDLELQDAGNIVNDLELKKINYKLGNNGRDISIDEGVIDKYRLQLATEGMMPENSSGFEIFDSIGLMVTDEDRKIMYQRALTGELQRSIMSIEVVNSAKVHLMLPVKSIFESEEKQASASVIIDLKPSKKITNDTIKGIAALISGAVDNLPDENIQIIDSKGNLLSNVLKKNENLNAMDVLNQYQNAQDAFQRKIENSLGELLGSAYGIEKIRVTVYADLDFDSEETTMITYDNPVIRSEQVSATGPNVQASQNNDGSINDNISNVIDVSVGDGSTFDRTTNNELSTETKTTIKAPGKVNRLTTSVIYDGNLTQEDVAKIHNIIATATGYDNARGDLINVEGVIFDRTYEEKMEKDLIDMQLEKENSLNAMEKFGEYAVIGLLGFLGILLLLAFIKRSISKKRNKVMLGYPEEIAMESTINEAMDEVDDRLEVKIDNKKVKAQNYAKENPEIATDLIKAWLKEQ